MSCVESAENEAMKWESANVNTTKTNKQKQTKYETKTNKTNQGN